MPDPNTQKILITGGCGYIGSHIVKTLTEIGEKVIVFDNLSHGAKDALLNQETLIVGDITSKSELERVFQDHQIDTVIHLAALVNAAESNKKQAEYTRVNGQGSRNVWEVASKAGVKHFLYASSAAVYGTPTTRLPVQESDPCSPSNPYGVTKLAGETSLKEIVPDDVNYLAFRFFNVGGAEEEGRLGQSKESRAIMQRLFAVVTGEDDIITISGNDYDTQDGTVVRDFVHVDDIALAFTLGINYLRGGGESRILNLGSGEDHTIGEVIKEVEVVSDKPIPIRYGPRIEGDIEYSLADIKQAQKILGWEPVHTLRLIVRDGYNSYVKRKTI
jgi:UDP-glucose 4-epimerase